MAQWRILRNDWSVDAIVTSTNEEPDASASAMLDYRHSERWRTQDLSTMQVTLDVGTPLPWDTLFLGYHSGTDAGNLRVTANDSAGTLFSSPAYNAPTIPLRYPGTGARTSYHAWHEAGSIQNYRYVGLEITDAGNPDGFFTAGIVYVGTLFTPSLHPKLGDALGSVDTSVPIELSNGESIVRRRRRKSKFQFDWEKLPESDAFFMANLAQIYGRSTPVVISGVPESPSSYGQNMLIYGFMDFPDGRAIVQDAPYGHWASSFSVTEV